MGHAVVTGAGGDIGRAIVQRLLAAGHHVEGWDIDETRLAQNKDRFGGHYVSRRVNILETSDVVDAAARTGAIDILVNNAGGVTASSRMANAQESDMVRDLDLNLVAAWRCLDAFTSALKSAGDGRVINVASANGLGVYGYPGYSAAKAGLIHLTKFAAVELGPSGIRVNAVAPGTVRTQAWDALIAKDPDILQNAKKFYPLGDICLPDDVAGVVAFLAGSDARMITGATIPVDGGLGAGSTDVLHDLTQSSD